MEKRPRVSAQFGRSLSRLFQRAFVNGRSGMSLYRRLCCQRSGLIFEISDRLYPAVSGALSAFGAWLWGGVTKFLSRIAQADDVGAFIAAYPDALANASIRLWAIGGRPYRTLRTGTDGAAAHKSADVITPSDGGVRFCSASHTPL